MKSNIDIHIYITEPLCCTAEINNTVNQLDFNKINFLKMWGHNSKKAEICCN